MASSRNWMARVTAEGERPSMRAAWMKLRFSTTVQKARISHISFIDIGDSRQKRPVDRMGAFRQALRRIAFSAI